MCKRKEVNLISTLIVRRFFAILCYLVLHDRSAMLLDFSMWPVPPIAARTVDGNPGSSREVFFYEGTCLYPCSCGINQLPRRLFVPSDAYYQHVLEFILQFAPKFSRQGFHCGENCYCTKSPNRSGISGAEVCVCMDTLHINSWSTDQSIVALS